MKQSESKLARQPSKNTLHKRSRSQAFDKHLTDYANADDSADGFTGQMPTAQRSEIPLPVSKIVSSEGLLFSGHKPQIGDKNFYESSLPAGSYVSQEKSGHSAQWHVRHSANQGF